MSHSSVLASAPVRTKATPRTEELTDRLLEAAAKLFLKNGFDGTSVGEIARTAHASKETLYRHFPTKKDLFLAVVIRRAQRHAADLSAVLLSEDPPAKALVVFGELILARMLAPESIAFYRLLTAERHRAPTLPESFRNHGPAEVRAALEVYLKAQMKKGRLRKLNPATASRQIHDLIVAEMMVGAMIFGRSRPSAEAVRQRVHEAVDCFLHGYGAE